MGPLIGEEMTADAEIEAGSDTTSHQFYQNQETAMRNINSTPDVHDNYSLQQSSHIVSVNDSESRDTKGKRKIGSTLERTEECSNPSSNDPEILNLQSSGQVSNLRPVTGTRTQYQSINMVPVIDVNDLPPPSSQHNARVRDESVGRNRQIQFDEILAHQLHNEFNNELQTGGMEEFDARPRLSFPHVDGDHGASSSREVQYGLFDARPRLSFPQVDGDHGASSSREVQYGPINAHPAISLPQGGGGHASSSTREIQHGFGDASTSSVMAGYYQSSSSARPAFPTLQGGYYEIPSSARPAFSTVRLMPENRVRRPPHVGIPLSGTNPQMRLSLLQTLGFDVHQVLNDFNDYGGPSEIERRINDLPQSVIQNENLDILCVICQEVPSVGDVIRHLRCSHKFHKECVDLWLREKMFCPICRSFVI